MDLNGWITVITIFLAVFALLPREDLVLIFRGISKYERILIFIIIIAIIPYLLVFEKLSQRWSFLKSFCVPWGFSPTNISFALFYLCFLWLILRIFIFKPKLLATNRNISFFIEILNTKPFEEFFKLFSKYTSKETISNHWEQYKELILHPGFLNQVIISKPSYIFQFWDKFTNEKEFQSIFLIFLGNQNSSYYKEIREHWNSYSLLPDKPFLNIIIKDNLRQSIDNGLLRFMADYIEKQLQSEKGKLSIYNQEHFSPRLREDEGWELPVYYHIRFIGLLYFTAIENRSDISTLSNRYTNITSFYSCIIENMLNNMDNNENEVSKVDSSNYRWLIHEIFDIQGEWAVMFFKKDQIQSTSSYQTFIPSSLASCIDELYKGYKTKKVTFDFLYNILYHNALDSYYDPRIENSFRASIENDIICKMSDDIRKTVFERSLNQKYAISYNDFKNENYTTLNEQYIEILKRLKRYLELKNLI